MKKGRFKMADPEFLIKQLGSVYSSAGEAFKEYTTNSVDAIYDAGISNGLINIIINQDQRWVLIQDNGVGMDYGHLSGLPEKLGESVKRFAKNPSGEKGVGNLSFLRLKADKLHFISRADKESELVNLLEADPDLNYQVDSIKPNQINNLPDTVRQIIASKLSRGTIVYLEGIDPAIMERNFLPSKLVSLMNETYTPLLKQQKLEIRVGYIAKGGRFKAYQPEPLEFGGEVVLEDSIDVKNVMLKDGKRGVGKIDLFITINPQSTDKKVRVYHKGVKVNNVTGIEFLDNEPWNLGKLDGFMDENFLTLNLPRTSFEFNENLALWLPRIKEIGDYLNVELKKYRSQRDRTSYELADRVMKAIDVIYRQLELRKFFSRKRTERRPTGTGETKKPEEDVDDVPDIPDRKTRLTVPFTPDFEVFGPEERHLRSKMVGRFIKINTKHENYQKYFEGKNEFERGEYLLDLLSKEIGFAAAKGLLTKDADERPSIDDIILKTKEIASDIYYGAQKQLKFNIETKV